MTVTRRAESRSRSSLPLPVLHGEREKRPHRALTVTKGATVTAARLGFDRQRTRNSAIELRNKRGTGNDLKQTDRRGRGRQHRLLCRRHVCCERPPRRAAGTPAPDWRNRKQRAAADEL